MNMKEWLNDEQKAQLEALKNDKNEYSLLYKKLYHKFVAETKPKKTDADSVKVTSNGKKLKEKKYSGTNMEQVNKLEKVVDVPVESNKLVNDWEEKESTEVENKLTNDHEENKVITTEDGDVVTICIG